MVSLYYIYALLNFFTFNKSVFQLNVTCSFLNNTKIVHNNQFIWNTISYIPVDNSFSDLKLNCYLLISDLDLHFVGFYATVPLILNISLDLLDSFRPFLLFNIVFINLKGFDVRSNITNYGSLDLYIEYSKIDLYNDSEIVNSLCDSLSRLKIQFVNIYFSIGNKYSKGYCEESFDLVTSKIEFHSFTFSFSKRQLHDI